jgi:hypothetical protein
LRNRRQEGGVIVQLFLQSRDSGLTRLAKRKIGEYQAQCRRALAGCEQSTFSAADERR